MKYDFIFEEKFKYGVINGHKDKILYIKVGNGGSIKGYKNKYLRLAKEINKKYGFSILVAETPINIDDYSSIEADFNFINQNFKSNNRKIYALGFSKGGVIINNYSYLFSDIKRALIINAPLMVNFHKIKIGFLNFKGEKLIFLYGKKDPSYTYVELLKKHKNFNTVIEELDDIDHNFTNNLEIFINLPSRYLFSDFML